MLYLLLEFYERRKGLSDELNMIKTTVLADILNIKYYYGIKEIILR